MGNFKLEITNISLICNKSPRFLDFGMIYQLHPTQAAKLVRILKIKSYLACRLWLLPRIGDESRDVQQIGYFNIIPEIRRYPRYEEPQTIVEEESTQQNLGIQKSSRY